MGGIEIIARGVIMHEGHVLLCRSLPRGGGSGHRYLPGGHVEFGERAADAVAREMMEECGLCVRVGACVLVEEHAFRQKGKTKQEVTIIFDAAIEGLRESDPLPVVRSLEDDLALEWVSVSSLGNAGFLPHSQCAWLVGRGRASNAGVRFLSTWEDA